RGPTGKKSNKVCLVLPGISYLVTYLMRRHIWFKKTRNGGINLRFSGKRIVIALETEIISQITKHRRLNGTRVIIQKRIFMCRVPVSFCCFAEQPAFFIQRIPLRFSDRQGILVEFYLQRSSQCV